MSDQVSKLKKLSNFFNQNHQRRLFFDSSIVSAWLLFTMCAIVSSQQYFGRPIECMVDESLEDKIPESVINNFCFISVTYSISGWETYERTPTKYHSFYPWISVVLLLQGLSFLLPNYFWACMDNGFFKNFFDDSDLLAVDDEKMQLLGRYLAKRLGSFKSWSYGYIVSEFLYTINVLLNFYITNIFLEGHFLKFGIQVTTIFILNAVLGIARVVYEEKPVGSKMFPLMTSCTFYKYGPSGTLENHDALCMMTLNILNDKFYIFLWFWFLLLLQVSTILVVCRLFFMITISMRKCCVPFIRLLFAPQLELTGVLVLIRKLSLADWILIQQLNKSMYPSSYAKLLENIVLEICEPQNLTRMEPRARQRCCRDTSV